MNMIKEAIQMVYANVDMVAQSIIMCGNLLKIIIRKNVVYVEALKQAIIL